MKAPWDTFVGKPVSRVRGLIMEVQVALCKWEAHVVELYAGVSCTIWDCQILRCWGTGLKV